MRLPVLSYATGVPVHALARTTHSQMVLDRTKAVNKGLLYHRSARVDAPKAGVQSTHTGPAEGWAGRAVEGTSLTSCMTDPKC